MKRHLSAKLHGTRGIHAHPEVLAMVEKMTPAEAEGWYRILQNIEEDVGRRSRSAGCRSPWRPGHYI